VSPVAINVPATFVAPTAALARAPEAMPACKDTAHQGRRFKHCSNKHECLLYSCKSKCCEVDVVCAREVLTQEGGLN
jgi:hypothetical protein